MSCIHEFINKTKYNYLRDFIPPVRFSENSPKLNILFNKINKFETTDMII